MFRLKWDGTRRNTRTRNWDTHPPTYLRRGLGFSKTPVPSNETEGVVRPRGDPSLSQNTYRHYDLRRYFKSPTLFSLLPSSFLPTVLPVVYTFLIFSPGVLTRCEPIHVHSDSVLPSFGSTVPGDVFVHTDSQSARILYPSTHLGPVFRL